MQTLSIACCPRCEAPLVETYKMPGKEWHCVSCRGWFEMFEDDSRLPTEELIDQHERNVAQFKSECRHMQHVLPCGPTGDDMYCACGCSGADEYCGATFIENVMALVGWDVRW